MHHRGFMEIQSARRTFATVSRLPWLARMQVRDPDLKPKGAKRIFTKVVRLAWTLLYHRLGLSARGSIVFYTHDGTTINVTVDATKALYIDYASRAAHGGYELAETLLIDAILSRASVFYDVGANWGYFSWLAATSDAFDGRIFSFEISPSMVKELEAIRTGAGFSTVRIMPFGLSDTNGTAPISDDANGHLSRIVNAGMPNSTLATIRRLDDLDIPLPDLIKIDVEDHERAVLEGAASLIKASRPVILFECREPKSPDNMAIIEMLAKLDYVLHYISVSADGVKLSAIDTSQPAFPAAACNIFACPKDRLTAWLS